MTDNHQMTEQDARDLCAGKYTTAYVQVYARAAGVLLAALDAEREAHAATEAERDEAHMALGDCTDPGDTRTLGQKCAEMMHELTKQREKAEVYAAKSCKLYTRLRAYEPDAPRETAPCPHQEQLAETRTKLARLQRLTSPASALEIPLQWRLERDEARAEVQRLRAVLEDADGTPRAP